MSNFQKTTLSVYHNDWYKNYLGATKLKQICWFLVNVICFINPLNPSSYIRVVLLKLFGARLGRNVIIKPGVNIKYPWKLSIGDYSWIGEKVWIDNLAEVSIGSNVCISQGAMLLTGNHNYSKSTFDLTIGKIIIEDGVWIGAKAVVCPGVICHSHAVLAVGSVATKELEPYSIYQGNPAAKIRARVIK